MKGAYNIYTPRMNIVKVWIINHFLWRIQFFYPVLVVKDVFLIHTTKITGFVDRPSSYFSVKTVTSQTNRGVSNHRQPGCLFSSMLRLATKEHQRSTLLRRIHWWVVVSPHIELHVVPRTKVKKLYHVMASSKKLIWFVNDVYIIRIYSAVFRLTDLHIKTLCISENFVRINS